MDTRLFDALIQIDAEDFTLSARDLFVDRSNRDIAWRLAADLASAVGEDSEVDRQVHRNVGEALMVDPATWEELIRVFHPLGGFDPRLTLDIVQRLGLSMVSYANTTVDVAQELASTLGAKRSLDLANTDVLNFTLDLSRDLHGVGLLTGKVDVASRRTLADIGKFLPGDEAERLARMLQAYLLIIWWRLAVIAWTTSVEVSDEPSNRTAVETLRGEAAQMTRQALESPLGALNQLLDDPSTALDDADEDYLRRQADTLRSQLGGDEPDRFIVERAIKLIVERLALSGYASDGARAVLANLGMEPPELIDETVEKLDALVASVTADWGEPGEENREVAARIASAGERADELIAVVEGAVLSDEHGSGLAKILSKAPVLLATGAATAVGSETTKALWTEYHVGEIVLRFVEAISKLWVHWMSFG